MGPWLLLFVLLPTPEETTARVSTVEVSAVVVTLRLCPPVGEDTVVVAVAVPSEVFPTEVPDSVTAVTMPLTTVVSTSRPVALPP